MLREIDLIQSTLYQLTRERMGELKTKSSEQLRDLIHSCDEGKTHVDWTRRVACEINRAAAELALAERE